MSIPFLITIDTEGDNLWEQVEITTENARWLPRFQLLCEKFQLKPTWLTNYEMAIDPTFVDFGRQVIASQTGEIGVHLHAWNSPPLHQVTRDKNDNHHKTLITDYPIEVADKKLAYLVSLLEDTFRVKMRSHRSGRWAFNDAIGTLLLRNGIEFDCTFTPGVNWSNVVGDPDGPGGPNYQEKPNYPHILHDDAAGNELLEIPMSVVRKPRNFLKFLGNIRRSLLRRKWSWASLLDLTQTAWLRPNGKNLTQMIDLLRAAKNNHVEHVEFMLHSSEFMPGGSPTFRSSDSIETLFEHMETLFAFAVENGFYGMTLAEFGDQWLLERKSK